MSSDGYIRALLLTMVIAGEWASIWHFKQHPIMAAITLYVLPMLVPVLWFRWLRNRHLLGSTTLTLLLGVSALLAWAIGGSKRWLFTALFVFGCLVLIVEIVRDRQRASRV